MTCHTDRGTNAREAAELARTASEARGQQVYAREGLACQRCRRQIVREKVAGRSTFFCPYCQV